MDTCKKTEYDDKIAFHRLIHVLNGLAVCQKEVLSAIHKLHEKPVVSTHEATIMGPH